MNRNLKKDNTVIDHLGYAFYAFGGLGIEILLMMIEVNLWGVQSNDWSPTQNITHWIITCMLWGVFSVVLLKKNIKTHSKVNDINWFIVIGIIICSIIYTSYTWGGFKSAIELRNNGNIKFIVQYIYYAFESMLILLIITHGQKAFDKSVKKCISLPVGGFLLAVTWGGIHILTQGVSTGIYACIQSLLFGMMYLVLKKDIKLSYMAIAFMFML